MEAPLVLEDGAVGSKGEAGKLSEHLLFDQKLLMESALSSTVALYLWEGPWWTSDWSSDPQLECGIRSPCFDSSPTL